MEEHEMRLTSTSSLRWLPALALAGLAALLSGRHPSQTVTAEPSVVDLGRIAQYAPAAGVTQITNRGRRPVRVSWAQPSCGCTQSRLSSLLLLPGRPTPL